MGITIRIIWEPARCKAIMLIIWEPARCKDIMSLVAMSLKSEVLFRDQNVRSDRWTLRTGIVCSESYGILTYRYEHSPAIILVPAYGYQLSHVGRRKIPGASTSLFSSDIGPGMRVSLFASYGNLTYRYNGRKDFADHRES